MRFSAGKYWMSAGVDDLMAMPLAHISSKDMASQSEMMRTSSLLNMPIGTNSNRHDLPTMICCLRPTEVGSSDPVVRNRRQSCSRSLGVSTGSKPGMMEVSDAGVLALDKLGSAVNEAVCKEGEEEDDDDDEEEEGEEGGGEGEGEKEEAAAG